MDEPHLVDTWKAMLKLPATGKVCLALPMYSPSRLTSTTQVKAIGVSNFTITNIKAVADATGVWPVRTSLTFSSQIAPVENGDQPFVRPPTKSSVTRSCLNTNSSSSARTTTFISPLTAR